MGMHNKKIMVSGIQPSNNITLGNYLGAIKPFVDLQNKYKQELNKKTDDLNQYFENQKRLRQEDLDADLDKLYKYVIKNGKFNINNFKLKSNIKKGE